MVKRILVHIRTSIKIMMLIFIAICLSIGAVAFLYKPIYSVSIAGTKIGYSGNKSELQARINEYINHGNGENNIAFVQVNDLPEYKLCLLKRGITTNDEEIFQKVKESGITYYKYYAILNENEEKLYVSDFTTAENIVNELKSKNSTNINQISILEKYETELKGFVSTEEAVASLYVEPVKEEPKVQKANAKVTIGKVNTSINLSYKNASLGGLVLARPISGTITSRFGSVSSVRSSTHSGLDIGAPSGTPIGAAASGTVTFAARKGSFGNLVAITHENGIQTYYGHCSKIYVTPGQEVKQGQTIAAVGSTGNSTGPHLHFEVRIDGVAYNPQNYLYK